MCKLTSLLLLSLIFVFSSCDKTTPVEDDPALVKYFGTWEFTKTDYGHYWDYVTTPNGTETVYTQMETIEWQRTGTVSMGRVEGELKIQWSGSSNDMHFATVLNTQGGLMCADNCENIPYVENGQGANNSSGEYSISDSTYMIDLGWSGGGSTVHTWDIQGKKL
jgi:hypothetical protein